VVENGNVLHVAWAVRELPRYTPQRVDVWYSTKQLASPVLTPVPTPVPSPTPTPTPVSTPVPATTPYPTLDSASPGLPDGLDTESDEILRLAIALSPAVLVISLVIMSKVGRFRKYRR
jgi:hypothetical protein